MEIGRGVLIEDTADGEGVGIPGPAELVALDQETSLAGDLWIWMEAGEVELIQGTHTDAFQFAFCLESFRIRLGAELFDPVGYFELERRIGG